MDAVQLANPWWVNLCALVPLLAFLVLRSHKPQLSASQLIYVTVCGIAFAFGEAVVVVYLRAASSLLVPTNLQEKTAISNPEQILELLPQYLLSLEVAREAATMVMLLTIALLSASRTIERISFFLWAFAIWDIFYYFFLWLTIRWPMSLLTADVLFLIPVPWVSQVWFPLLVSACTLIAIFINRQIRPKIATLPP